MVWPPTVATVWMLVGAALLTSKLFALTMQIICVGLPQAPSGSTWGTGKRSDARQVAGRSWSSSSSSASTICWGQPGSAPTQAGQDEVAAAAHPGCVRPQDNYVWLLREPSGCTAIVDPSEAAPVAAALDRLGWHPDFILNTHHHWDHTGCRHPPDTFPPHWQPCLHTGVWQCAYHTLIH